jgi:hypothetical protein
VTFNQESQAGSLCYEDINQERNNAIYKDLATQMNSEQVRTLEELSLNAWPALRQVCWFASPGDWCWPAPG